MSIAIMSLASFAPEERHVGLLSHIALLRERSSDEKTEAIDILLLWSKTHESMVNAKSRQI